MTKRSKSAQTSFFSDLESGVEAEGAETKINEKDKDEDVASTPVGTALVPVVAATKPAVRDDLEHLATSIRERLKNSSRDAIKIGNDLLKAKKKLGHGAFLPWVKANVGMSERTAERYMALSQRLGSKFDTVSDLPLAMLHRLAAPSMPDEMIDVAIALRNDNPDCSPADVWRIVSHERRALKARQQSDAEGGPAMTSASGTASRALSVTTDVQAGGAEQEAAQIIAIHLRDELPRLIELLGNSDLFTLVRHLKQLTSR
ncbi:MAG: DUF3102 domain-containing protein [Burkholderiales bacterium]|nr:DUF3102 domain-containing protein [Burkholderiales bacterium]